MAGAENVRRRRGGDGASFTVGLSLPCFARMATLLYFDLLCYSVLSAATVAKHLTVTLQEHSTRKYRL